MTDKTDIEYQKPEPFCFLVQQESTDCYVECYDGYRNSQAVYSSNQMQELLDQLEAERQQREAAEKERDALKSAHDNLVTRCALLRQRHDLPIDRIPAYEALVKAQDALRGEQEPVAFMDVQHGREDGNLFAVAFTKAGHALKDDVYELFISPSKPVVVPEIQQLKEAVDFYLQVQKENPPVEQGMHKDADEWIKRVAIEAAGIVVKDGE